MTNQQPTILIAEDTRTIRLLIKKALEDYGYLVVEAENGLEAVQLFEQTRPQAVLLDVEMPVLDGIAACKRLRELPDCRYTPIMMLTSRNDHDAIVKSFEAGATEFTTKPINWDILGYRIKYLIRTGNNFIELMHSKAELSKARDELEKVNVDLEKRVSERTESLKKTTDELQVTLDSLRKTQSQLIESEKTSMLTNLLDGIAREAHSPIDTSINVIESLKNNLNQILTQLNRDDSKQKEIGGDLKELNIMVSSIHDNLQRASELIKNLKQLTIEKTTETTTKIKLKEYLDEVIYGLRPVMKKTKIQIVINCPDDLVIISYPNILFRIIMNLVTNTVLHAYDENEQGQIQIEASSENSGVIIRYSDNGRGMDDQVYTKIFEPFNTTMVNTTHIGLGLYLVYTQITTTLSGTIKSVNSPGKGLSYIINLPKCMESVHRTVSA